MTKAPIRIGINGFGRIGRSFLRVALSNPDIEVVAVNDLASLEALGHLFKYDSIHGRLHDPIDWNDDVLQVNNKSIFFYQEDNPEQIPWKKHNVDVVIEATGKFRSQEKAQAHTRAGAKKVILSAPPEDDTKTIVLGINDEHLSKDDIIVSNASCTTNSAAPLISVLNDSWGIEQAYITTVHSYTTDQRLHDAPHKDLRRARAAGQSIVPTTTGAAKALTKVFPELDGRIGGAGIRVPVPNGSLTDLSCILKEDVTKEAINEAFRLSAQNQFKGILEYIDEPIVSIDVIDNPHSCVFDSLLTSALGKMVKVVGWYDNEWGYSNRLIELALKMNSFD